MDRGALLTHIEKVSEGDLQTDNESFKNEEFNSNDPNMINLDIQPEIQHQPDIMKTTQQGSHPFHKQKTYNYTKMDNQRLENMKRKSKEVSMMKENIGLKIRQIYKEKLKEAQEQFKKMAQNNTEAL